MSHGGEFSFIRWIRERTPRSPWVAVGIWDDAAVMRLPSSDCLFAVDMLMEGTHFTFPPVGQSALGSGLQAAPPGSLKAALQRPAETGRFGHVTPRQVGRKSLAVNLSDIAAMAGRPLAAVVAAAFPRGRGDEFAREVQAGVQELADEFGVALAGGDTNVWDGPLVLSVAVLGEPTGSGPVLRSGARVGDWILATGAFGGSRAGRHFAFPPRVPEAIRLHESAALHAMIDVSDGLAADLCHILDESGVGAVLYEEAIPISDAAGSSGGQPPRGEQDGRSPLERALSDGEDFELVFTVSADDGRRLLAQPPVSVPLSHIGQIVAAGTRALVDATGGSRPLGHGGWEHTY